MIDSPHHKAAPWQLIANFIRCSHVPGVQLRSLPWPHQQELLALFFPQKASAKAKGNPGSGRNRQSSLPSKQKATPELVRKILTSKTSTALKRELLSRNLPQMGTKMDLVERLMQAFLTEEQHHTYRWWSDLEVELNDFYQHVKPTEVPHVHKTVFLFRGDRDALNKWLGSTFDGRTLDSVQNKKKQGGMDNRRVALLVTASSAARGPGAQLLAEFLRRDRVMKFNLGDNLTTAQRSNVVDILQRAVAGSQRIAAVDATQTQAPLAVVQPKGTSGAPIPAAVVQAAVVRSAPPGHPQEQLQVPNQTQAQAQAQAQAQVQVQAYSQMQAQAHSQTQAQAQTQTHVQVQAQTQAQAQAQIPTQGQIRTQTQMQTQPQLFAMKSQQPQTQRLVKAQPTSKLPPKRLSQSPKPKSPQSHQPLRSRKPPQSQLQSKPQVQTPQRLQQNQSPKNGKTIARTAQQHQQQLQQVQRRKRLQHVQEVQKQQRQLQQQHQKLSQQKSLQQKPQQLNLKQQRLQKQQPQQLKLKQQRLQKQQQQLQRQQRQQQRKEQQALQRQQKLKLQQTKVSKLKPRQQQLKRQVQAGQQQQVPQAKTKANAALEKETHQAAIARVTLGLRNWPVAELKKELAARSLVPAGAKRQVCQLSLLCTG